MRAQWFAQLPEDAAVRSGAVGDSGATAKKVAGDGHPSRDTANEPYTSPQCNRYAYFIRRGYHQNNRDPSGQGASYTCAQNTTRTAPAPQRLLPRVCIGGGGGEVLGGGGGGAAAGGG